MMPEATFDFKILLLTHEKSFYPQRGQICFCSADCLQSRNLYEHLLSLHDAIFIVDEVDSFVFERNEQASHNIALIREC